MHAIVDGIVGHRSFAQISWTRRYKLTTYRTKCLLALYFVKAESAISLSATSTPLHASVDCSASLLMDDPMGSFTQLYDDVLLITQQMRSWGSHNPILLVVVVICLYLASLITYGLYLSPLAGIPGPGIAGEYKAF